MKLVLAKFDSGLNDWLLRELMNGKVDDVGDCEQQRTKKRRYNNTPLLMRSAQGMAAEEDIVHSTDGSYCTSTIPVQSEDSHEVSPAFDIIIVNPDSSTEVSGDASAGCDSHERDAYPHSVDHHCLDSHTNSVYSDNSRVDRVTRQNEENPCCDEDSAVAGEAEKDITVAEEAENDSAVAGEAEKDITVAEEAENDSAVAGEAEKDITVAEEAENDSAVAGEAEKDITVAEEAENDSAVAGE
eukprot:Lankesteria_metandrocarpae@DN3407_c0_g1_i2.p1